MVRNRVVALILLAGCNSAASPPDHEQDADIGGWADLGGRDTEIGAGVIVAPVELTVTEGGGTGTIWVTLQTRPTSDVEVVYTSSDPSELANPPTLTFTPTSYIAPQALRVGAVDDTRLEGPHDVVLSGALRATGDYAEVALPDVRVRIEDDEVPGVLVDPVELHVVEATPGQTFAVSLLVEPPEMVEIDLAPSMPEEIAIDRDSLTFSPDSFDVPQLVRVTVAVNPLSRYDGPLSVLVGPSRGAGYDGYDPPDVNVTITRQNLPVIVVVPPAVTTSESGTTATFQVSLNSQPVSPVTMSVVSSAPSEGVVFPASLAFDGSNFDGPRAVTVTGVDDALPDGAQTYTVVLETTSDDTLWDGVDGAAAVTNLDDDVAGAVLINPTNLSVFEAGPLSATFTVALASAPGETVHVDIGNASPIQLLVSPPTLSFDDTNFGTPQAVTVTAMDDTLVEGNIAYPLVTTMIATMAYAQVEPPDVTVLVVDDD